MKKEDLIRAWKDADFRDSLEDAPKSPAGLVELDDSLLASMNGAVEISITDTGGCTVSGWKISCGYVCTYTTECTCAAA